jgi:hypothetical protein
MFSYGGTKDFTVNLRASNPYCSSGPTQQEDTHLGPLIFRGERNDIVQYAPPCPGTLGPQNFTDLLADLRQGSTYPLALSVVTCNKEYPNILTAVWIDFNSNGVWEDNEQVVAPNTHFGAIFTQVTVPVDAVVGPTSMRAMVQEVSAGQTSIGPCDQFRWGGTQDYPLRILSATEPGMQSREQENGMNYREQKVAGGMQFREEQPQQQQIIGMQYRENIPGMKYREEETIEIQEVGMKSREKELVGMKYREEEQEQEVGMQYREEKIEGMQFREKEQIQGMQYREETIIGMQYREEKIEGMQYRENNTHKRICPKKMGMRYRENKHQENNMQYREKELSGMRYREE